MKKIKLIITIIFSIAIASAIVFSLVGCGDGGGGSSAYADNGGEPDNGDGDTTDPNDNGETDPGNGDDPINPESPKYYIMNPFESAEFYFVTTAGKEIYAYNDGYIKKIKLTMTVSQEGKADVIENITPVDFYKLGDMFFVECKIENETRYFRQVYGVMTEVESLMRRPDTMRQQMNNGRFSITTNTWTTYTVSDIRNETTESGICRTLICQGYYLGKRESYYDYGLWFCTIDDFLTVKRSGLYFWAEAENGGIEKVIDEAGELWK